MTLILSNEDVEELLTMQECIEALEDAYAEVAEGRGAAGAQSDCGAPTTRPDIFYALNATSGVIPKLGVGAVRIKSDIVSWPKKGGNVRREKLPAAPNARFVGLVLLFSTETGEPLAIFPDGVMQRLRVGAASALGIKYLARKAAKTVGILGSGWQAGAQLAGAVAVRDIDQIRCFSPNPKNRMTFAEEMTETLGVLVTAVGTPEEAVAATDIVMCATNTMENVFFEGWVEPGMHLSSIKRPEIEASAIRRASLVVVHNNDLAVNIAKGSGLPDRANHRREQAEEIDFRTLPNLYDLISGKTPRRSAEDDVTCFLNNFGLGFQFAAAGSVLYRKARQKRAGHDLPTDWFTQTVHP